jgi:hypothetical protein
MLGGYDGLIRRWRLGETSIILWGNWQEAEGEEGSCG